MKAKQRNILFFLGVLLISVAMAYLSQLNLSYGSNTRTIADSDFKIESRVITNKDINAKSTDDLKTTQIVNNHDQETKEAISKEIGKLSGVNFPLGWYDNIQSTKELSKIAREGINLMIPYVGTGNEETIKAYLDAANDRGIKVLVEIPRSRVQAEEQEQERITQFIRNFKNHPSVFGWYLYDEPEITQANHYIPPEKLQVVYNRIKTEDPTRPVAVVFGKLNLIKDYKNATDIVMFDAYPCFYEKSEFGGKAWEKYDEWIKVVADTAQNNLAFWNVLQAFGEDLNGKPQFNKRLPTVAEERYMFYTSLLSGADGILFWTRYRSQPNWIDSVLTPIIRDFGEYAPAIKNGGLAEGVTVSGKDIQASVYQYPDGKSYLLIAIHNGLGEVETTLKLNPSIVSNSSLVKEKNRSIELTSTGTFRDSFAPYEVHIYSIH